MIPKGLRVLRQANRSYHYTIKQLEECEQKHRMNEYDCGCDNCEYRHECKERFDNQINTRNGRTW